MNEITLNKDKDDDKVLRRPNIHIPLIKLSQNFAELYFVQLASQDATEVMFVTDSLTVSTNLTDVTLVSDDTY